MTLQGKTRTYELDTAGTNARCRVEEQTDRRFEDVVREIGGRYRPKPATVRAFLIAVLVDPIVTSDGDADRALKDIGGMAMVRRAAQAALKGRKRRRAKD